MDQSKFKAILRRILFLFSKVILGLILLSFVLLLILHSPPVQKLITAKVSRYLSATTRAKVDIEEIRFSLWGALVVNGLEVDDPEGNSLLTAQKLAVRPNIMLLLSGNLTFTDVDMADVNFHLINTAEGLNIQFIIDAFQPAERPPPSDEKKISIQVTRVNFENLHFQYSRIDSLELDVKLGKLDADDFELSTNPNIIRSKKIYLERAMVTTISSKKSKDDNSLGLFPLDFGSGFHFDVDIIELKDNDIAFHVGKMDETLHFDPDHLVLRKTQLRLTDIFIRDDSLSFDVQHFSTKLPGFSLSGLRTQFQSNLHRFNLSEFILSSADSELRLDLLSSYDHWPNLLNDLNKASFELSVFGSINPAHLRYFLHDSVSSIFENWPNFELEINGQLSTGNADINALKLRAGKSLFTAEGRIEHLLDTDNISWQDLNINTTVGPTFNSFVSPYIGKLKLPQELQIQLVSSGNLNSFDLQSEVNSSGGIVHSSGKASLKQDFLAVDLMIDGDKVDLGEIVDTPWLGPMDLTLHTVGDIGSETNMELTGQIEKISFSDSEIKNIDLQGSFNMKGATVTMQINDPDYGSTIQSEIQFKEPLSINSSLQLNDFGLGKLLPQKSSLLVNGGFSSNLSMDQSSMDGFFKGQDISLKTDSINYDMDSLALVLLISPTSSAMDLYSDNITGVLEANFDIQKGPELINNLLKKYIAISDSTHHPQKDRKFSFKLEVESATPVKFFDNRLEDFSGFHITGKYDENDQSLEVEAMTSKFNGFGISLDTLHAGIDVFQDNINAILKVDDIHYDKVKIGNMDFHILNKGDSALSNFTLTRDSISILDIATHSKSSKDGVYIYLDSLASFDKGYSINQNNPVVFGDKNLLFNQFTVSKDELEIIIEGDLNKIDLTVNNADLRNLNYLIASDSAIISNGNLDGKVFYNRTGKQINIQATIDSLIFKNTPPINITAKAITEGARVPIEFSLKSATNNIELAGVYFMNNSEIDALLAVDINDLEVFQFLFADKMEEISGKVYGKTRITGTLQNPKYQGSLRFHDVDFTTANPRSNFKLRDEIITLDNSGVTLDEFTMYDQWDNPLTLNGTLRTEDYQSFEYDLTLDTDNYLLINNPSSEEYQLQGMLVVGSNLKLKGNEQDTYVDANIIIKDTTELTYVTSRENIELLTGEGIVEFVDPEQATDSLSISQTQSFYDSLISTLPNFSLKSVVSLEDQAVFRVIVDARSGDFIEVSGAADLELNFDRTGNVQLEGSYSITKGFYQLSFYDLVKKKFNIAPGSSVNWSGNPNGGDVDFKAIHSISTSSIGLIGHEIGENEKAVYRKSLPYEVGIVITGTIEYPLISFTLDLPKEEKVNYPALANKLDRLKQPEFESELNKQVFGLLVLGGFIPEASASDLDQSLIATTALSNSVNSILAGQLNRFAGQLVKGVDINVGLQSYSDYTSGGGQTRTAMDFRVTKRLMDDRLSIEVGGGLDINSDQSGANTGGDSFRGDITVIYDLTESGSKQLKVFNNETYDIIYHEIRNTGISLIFIKEFDRGEKEPKQ